MIVGEEGNATKMEISLGTETRRQAGAPESLITVKPCEREEGSCHGAAFMLDVFNRQCSMDSNDETGPRSFAGASHPLEPTDTDIMKPAAVYVPISGSFGEDSSNPAIHHKKPVYVLLPGEILIEDRKVPSSSFSSSFSAVPAKPEDKECVWDTSLPASANASPHSSVDSAGIVTAMSGVNSSSAITSESTKGSVSAGMNSNSLESGKTSGSRGSNSSGLSDESSWSNFAGNANKPHKGNDPRWKAIIAIRHRDGILGMSHFRLLKRLGCGDIGSVYLSELSGTRCYFAMKVMDKASLASRKKLTRSQTEREILQLLDHPFLPTLYTHFETDRFSCLVMEYCPGGDLHTLRQRQPGKYFTEYAARFYAAEVLLALEYLHMLGVVYRDLKPENVLVRDDGHIMLSDFDLSLQCAVSPTLLKSAFDSSSDPARGGLAATTTRSFCVQPYCIEPTTACMQPACLAPIIFPSKNKKKQRRTLADSGKLIACSSSSALPELVAEPTAARSMSFVGTHEYLAPEIIKGEGHGSAVDWWTFGIFLHELLFGKTPFKGMGNRATLFNVVGQQLRFPDSPATSYAGRDLIRGLLVKEPQHRFGVKRGATEIKQHPFFDGVNWALIRCSTPPEVPRPIQTQIPGSLAVVNPIGFSSHNKTASSDLKSGGKYLDFEFF